MAGRPAKVRYRNHQSTGSNARIDLSGPFFQPDMQKRFDKNVRKMLEGLASEGERTVRARVARFSKSGDYAAGIKGRVGSLEGAPWWQHAVVTATHAYPWPNKRTAPAGAMYRGSNIPHNQRAFRAVAGQMRRARAVLQANLTEGLN